MATPRRILAHDDLGPTIRPPPSRDPQRTCRHEIELDGVTYRCRREVAGLDRTHGGIHDAFQVHTDGGSVRW